jgi:hypothetical protein
MFDPSGLQEGQRVRIGYRDKSLHRGVRGLIIRVGSEDVLIRSDKSGADITVPLDNIEQVQSLDEVPSTPLAVEQPTPPPVVRSPGNGQGDGVLETIVGSLTAILAAVAFAAAGRAMISLQSQAGNTVAEAFYQAMGLFSFGMAGLALLGGLVVARLASLNAKRPSGRPTVGDA